MNNKRYVKLVENVSNKLDEDFDDLNLYDHNLPSDRERERKEREDREKAHQAVVDDNNSDLNSIIGKAKVGSVSSLDYGIDIGNAFDVHWAQILSNNEEIGNQPFIQRGIYGWTEQIVKYLNDQKIKSKVPLIQSWLILNCVKLLAGQHSGKQKNLFPSYEKYLKGKELEDTTKDAAERSEKTFIHWETKGEYKWDILPTSLEAGNNHPEVSAFTYFIKKLQEDKETTRKVTEIFLSIARYTSNNFITWGSAGSPKIKKLSLPKRPTIKIKDGEK